MGSDHSVRYRVFLLAAWAFIAYNIIGMLVGWLAALAASNGSHGNIHDVGHQAIAGSGTALSPPLWFLVIVALAALAATRNRWIGRLGAFLAWFYAGFYLSAGQIEELTSKTSPLTGAKWDLVLVLGSIGLAIAAIVLLTGLRTFVITPRSKRPRALQVGAASTKA